MKDTTEILIKLRRLMQNHPSKPGTSIAAYIIPSDDAHQSEYICEHDERRAYVSGFDGSAGTAVVTMEKALLWTDGRYYQQALKQLDENWILMKDGLPSTPSIGSWLSRNIPKGSTVGVDPKLFSYRVWKHIKKDCSLVPVEENLVDIVWGSDQPAVTSNEIVTLDLEFCGETIAEKWLKVKNQMNEKACGTLVVRFLNLRGSDIKYNPVFFAYLIVTKNTLRFFVNSSKLPKDFDKHQINNEVEITVNSYESIGKELTQIVNESTEKVWISPNSSYYLSSLIQKKQRHQEITPIAINKSIKNATEMEGFINCHIRDGIALCRYFSWLEDMVLNNKYVDEISGAKKLEEFRAKNQYFMGLSFPTISSSGPNGSVIHYQPTEETNRQINNKEIYLCDSGAQYLDGTTDVTRTVHFGNPTDFERECYTRVLKGQLVLDPLYFLKKL
ncbi:hypothetical protein DOY81_013516, partial [Sarcophaga bullata]